MKVFAIFPDLGEIYEIGLGFTSGMAEKQTLETGKRIYERV